MTTQEFIVKLTPENTDLFEKMKAVKAPEEAYAAAQAEGVTDSYDEFVAVMTKTYEAIKDLSEDDLESVAGGNLSTDQVVILSATISATGVTGMAAVSLAAVIGLAV
jgi:hypothetical protein